MMQFDRMTLGKKARELGFVRDTFEKVCRLADVLDYNSATKKYPTFYTQLYPCDLGYNGV